MSRSWFLGPKCPLKSRRKLATFFDKSYGACTDSDLPTTGESSKALKSPLMMRRLALMSAEVAAGSSCRCAGISLLVVSMSQPVFRGAGRRRRRRSHGGRAIPAARCQPRTSHRRRLHVKRQSVRPLLLLQWKLTFAAHYVTSAHTPEYVARKSAQRLSDPECVNPVAPADRISIIVRYCMIAITSAVAASQFLMMMIIINDNR